MKSASEKNVGMTKKMLSAYARHIGGIAFCLVFLFTTSCAGLFDKGPAYSTKAAADISTTPLRDKTVSAYVNQIAENLAKQESPDRIRHQKIDVNVLATARIQGRSYFYSSGIEITRGMLNALTNEAELAALIGHEIGHKVLHSKGSTFIPKNFSTRDIEYADWSQRREREADEYGAMLANKAGYDPYALLDFLDRLSKFQKGGILAWLNETESTHKDFRNRARDLKKFLTKSKLEPGQGFKKSSEYAKGLSSLKTFSTNDAVNEILPGGPRAAVAKLAEIETEILGFKRDKTPMPIERFMEIMGEISQIAKLYGLEPTAVGYKKRSGSGSIISINFMKEVLSQDSPLWDSEVLSKKIADILLLMSGIGAGFIPMVGDAVDLHELLTGGDYFTQTRLSFGERVLSAAGLLAGSGTGWRTVAEGIDKTLDDARFAKKLGRSEIADARHALDGAEEIGDGVSQWGKYTPINPGPLEPKVVQSFRSGTYLQETLSKPVDLYRAYNDPAKKLGHYWTRIPPKGYLQAQIDLALPPGNLATDIVKIQVPTATTIYEGIVAPEFGRIGGGNQIYIPKVNSSWVIP